MPTPLVGSRRFLLYDYFSVVSRRFYASDMYIMSQSPPVISELTHFHRLHQQEQADFQATENAQGKAKS